MLKIEVAESHYKPVIIWYDGIPSILLSTSTLLQRHFKVNFNALLKQVADNVEVY